MTFLPELSVSLCKQAFTDKLHFNVKQRPNTTRVALSNAPPQGSMEISTFDQTAIDKTFNKAVFSSDSADRVVAQFSSVSCGWLTMFCEFLVRALGRKRFAYQARMKILPDLHWPEVFVGAFPLCEERGGLIGGGGVCLFAGDAAATDPMSSMWGPAGVVGGAQVCVRQVSPPKALIWTGSQWCSRWRVLPSDHVRAVRSESDQNTWLYFCDFDKPFASVVDAGGNKHEGSGAVSYVWFCVKHGTSK